MKKAKRLLLGATAVVLALSLAGCSVRDMVATVVKKFVSTSSSEESEELDKRVYAEEGGSVTFPETDIDTFNPTGRFSTLVQDGSLYIAFNDITKKTTDYFYVSGNSITLSSYATTASPGSLNYKAALWELADDGSSMVYVNGSTVYFAPDGVTRTHTVTGLEPGRQYKITVSYDSGSYYVSGGFQITGVSGEAPAADPEGGAES